MFKRFCLYILSAAAITACENVPSAAHIESLKAGADVMCASQSDCASSESCTAQRCASTDGIPYPITLRLSYPDAAMPVFLDGIFQPNTSFGVFAQPQPISTTLSISYDQTPLAGTLYLTPAESLPDMPSSPAFKLDAAMRPIPATPGVYNLTFYPSATGNTPLPTMYFDNIPFDQDHTHIALNIQKSLQNNIEDDNAWWSGTFTLSYLIRRGTSDAVANGKSDDDKDPDKQERIGIRISDTESPAQTALIPMPETCSDAKCFTSLDIPMPPQRINTTRIYRISTTDRPTKFLKITTDHGNFKLRTDRTKNDAYASLISDITVTTYPYIPFQGQLLAPSAQSANNATVNIAAADKEKGIHWTSTASALTGSDGRFRLDIPQIEGNFTYSVNVSFEPGHSMASECFTFSSLDSLKQIFVTPKTRVSGKITRKGADTGIENALLRFSPRSSLAMETTETTTDADGNYSVLLNHRLYDIEIVPQTTSGLPTTFAALNVSDENAISADFEINDANVLFGTCLDVNAIPLPNVRAEAYTRSADGKTVKLATGISDDYGLLRLFIPSTNP